MRDGEWVLVGANATLDRAIVDEKDWRDWNENKSISKPYGDFRIVEIKKTYRVISAISYDEPETFTELAREMGLPEELN